MLTPLAWIIAVLLAIPLSTLLVELIAGALLARKNVDVPPPDMTEVRVKILMPAHNEAGSIAGIIEKLAPALNTHRQLLVVADNCSDETAQVARKAGAQVIERQDAQLRGKGHALAFGRDFLADDPPDCVVVLDADCLISPDSLDRLVAQTLSSNRPVQSCYLLQSRPEDGPMVQISNFAFLVKNLIRQRGDALIGAPAILGGTGMAFPWPLFANAPLASSHLVEDLQLGIHFARQGKAPRFAEAALTLSAPTSQADTLKQRSRWEHGFIQSAFHQGLPLIGEGLAKFRPGLLWLGLHLFVPPLVLLMILGSAGLLITGGLVWLGALATPTCLLAALLGGIIVMLAIAWARDGRDTISLATLARIPLYMLWKIPVYLRLVGKRETEWVRTKRTGE